MTKQKNNPKQQFEEHLVSIRTIPTDVGEIYRMEIAEIPIIPYLTIEQARNTGIFMEKIVHAVINDQKNPNPVIVEPITSDFGMIYRIVICGVPLRAYISRIEAEQEATFFESVVSAIITKVNQKR